MMKNILVTLLFIFTITLSFAQNKRKSESERVKPTWGVTLERKVLLAEIEKKYYSDVTVELKAAELDDMFVEGVKVVVVDNNTQKKIYKKRFSKSYLYAFSDGTIQVGKGNALTQVILSKIKDGNGWVMTLKEKGIY